MDELIPGERASRDFRVKFPDDVIQDNLAGQLWFGAEVINIILSQMNKTRKKCRGEDSSFTLYKYIVRICSYISVILKFYDPVFFFLLLFNYLF